MSEPDAMDALLRRAFENQPVPTVSPSFERRISRHIARGQLTPIGRGVLIAYAAAAVAASIWTMRSMSIEWSLIAVAILTPAMIVFASLRRRVLRRAGR